MTEELSQFAFWAAISSQTAYAKKQPFATFSIYTS